MSDLIERLGQEGAHVDWNNFDPRNTANLLREAATRIRKLETELEAMGAKAEGYRAGQWVDFDDMRERAEKAEAEMNRLRAENERLESEISTTMTMRLKAENDRLRAEKAGLREALEDMLNLKQGCHERAEVILARTNETEGK